MSRCRALDIPRPTCLDNHVLIEHKDNFRTLRLSPLCHDRYTDSRARSGHPISTAVSVFFTSLPHTQQTFNASKMVVLAALFLLSYAATSTDATQNQTHDHLVHGWVSTNCGRGTFDILCSCLFTIFLCVWTTFHRPIPHYREEKNHSFRTTIVRSNIAPAIIGLIFPEFLIITAIKDFLTARKIKNKLRGMNYSNITLIHGFFFNMGGFCLRSSGPKYHQLRPLDIQHLPGRVYLANSIRDLSNISEDQIKDFATSNNITKFLACLQVVWQATHVVSRLIQHQALTLLEVSTTAYVPCALIAYAFWWKKPQTCALPIIIDCSDEAMHETSPSPYEPWERTPFEFICNGQSWYGDDEIGYRKFVSLFLFGPSVFGVVHIAFWDITLPTNIELWLWRASIISCLVIPILLTLVFYVGHDASKKRFLWGVCMHSLILAYILCRIYMLVENFVSLRALPSSAFDTVHWLSFVPHI